VFSQAFRAECLTDFWQKGCDKGGILAQLKRKIHFLEKISYKNLQNCNNCCNFVAVKCAQGQISVHIARNSQ